MMDLGSSKGRYLELLLFLYLLLDLGAFGAAGLDSCFPCRLLINFAANSRARDCIIDQNTCKIHSCMINRIWGSIIDLISSSKANYWGGVEWSGVEWSGVEWSGVEWSTRVCCLNSDFEQTRQMIGMHAERAICLALPVLSFGLKLFIPVFNFLNESFPLKSLLFLLLPACLFTVSCLPLVNAIACNDGRNMRRHEELVFHKNLRNPSTRQTLFSFLGRMRKHSLISFVPSCRTYQNNSLLLQICVDQRQPSSFKEVI
jgi:hypothetical protein